MLSNSRSSAARHTSRTEIRRGEVVNAYCRQTHAAVHSCETRLTSRPLQSHKLRLIMFWEQRITRTLQNVVVQLRLHRTTVEEVFFHRDRTHKRKEASTHESAETHAGTVYVLVALTFGFLALK